MKRNAIESPSLFDLLAQSVEEVQIKPAIKPSVPALVAQLKDAGQDHEWYPTTNQIIDAMAGDLVLLSPGNCYDRTKRYSSVLDIGAGNGKVLMALKERTEKRDEGRHHLDDLLAIEKSSILCRQLPADVLVVGTDFHEQTLYSKAVDIIFCNPPYSEFEAWAEKIIRQSAAKLIYLVLPVRWEKSVPITDALRFRGFEAIKVGEFDFESAEDRKARAKVHLLRIEPGRANIEGHRYQKEGSNPFDLLFGEQFAELIDKYNSTIPKAEGRSDEAKEKREYHDLVVGPSYPDALVGIYRKHMARIENNYRLVNALDVELMRELEVSPDRIKECLKKRLDGLRHEYWHELFAHLNAITDRLTSASRKKVLDRLEKHVSVDFTVHNIYEIVVWAIKNANKFIDSQLIDTYELMVSKCNVVLYKSNKRVWVENRWRSRDEADPNSHFALDYRIVTHEVGGVTYQYGRQELNERAADFIGDLLTLARNLGFQTETNDHRFTYHGRHAWAPGKREEFRCLDRRKKDTLICDVRGFQNGNLHLRLNKDFMLALNVEHGRLKGWLRSAAEAADELQDPNAAEHFNKLVQIPLSDPARLLTGGAV